MALLETLQVLDLVDRADASGAIIAELFRDFPAVQVEVKKITGDEGSTDFVRILIPGTNGKSTGGDAPTFGIIGRLGGLGARPSRIGFVSDGDGAVAAITGAYKLAKMNQNGDKLKGDVIVATHVCPDAPTQPHEPVDFMGSPVDMQAMNEYEVDPAMEAILSIDTTKGNQIINHRGFAISPTVKEGYILRVSPDLVRIMEMTTGQRAVTFPITTQDITPYGNGVYHVNSILQPTVATSAPVVGVAITAETAVPGCGTGASHEVDIAAAARYAVEVAKEFTNGTATLHDADEFAHLENLYGPMKVLQTFGKVYSK
ncbi:DUF1177 domain-containing protein [Risungbinella massiliensis]|uniref:DUF1177 domain-containing protein n=1 Tax=Risungbinella massiliensis TaxID=1329796 RepID=UPI0005CBAD50|nr:DUF1177 domain-containing protein [Risungbinella massiliensis]